MKRRFGSLLVGLVAVGSLQMAVAPAASAAEISADPNCPWSPVTMFVKGIINQVDEYCDENTTFGCPLP